MINPFNLQKLDPMNASQLLMFRLVFIVYAALGLVSNAMAGTEPSGARGVVSARGIELVPADIEQVVAQSQLEPMENVTFGPLLRARNVLLIDKETNRVVYSKEPGQIAPIASITKLMTALIVMQSQQPLKEILYVRRADLVKGGRSYLKVGVGMRRQDFLHLALMSSDNVAAQTVGANYPGGVSAFVAKMNQTARQLGMNDTHFVDPTGLELENRASAWDLTKLLEAAQKHPAIAQLSTAEIQPVRIGKRRVNYKSSNGLVRSGDWQIDIQKTGFLARAGQCMVMQFRLHDRPFVAVILDSYGRGGRVADAQAIRDWLETNYFARPQTLETANTNVMTQVSL